MANYYTEASFELAWPLEAAQYLIELGQLFQECLEPPESGPLAEDYEDLCKGYDADHYPDYRVALDEGMLWLAHDESFDVGFVSDLIQVVMKRFDITEPVGFEWSAGCSRPIIDAFGGGAIVITPEQMKHINTHVWLTRTMNELKES